MVSMLEELVTDQRARQAFPVEIDQEEHERIMRMEIQSTAVRTMMTSEMTCKRF